MTATRPPLIPKRFLLVLGTFLLSVLLYVDRVCISTAKEPISRDLNLSEVEFGLAMSIFALGYALFQTPGGWLADRLGPRRVLTAVVVFWSIFTGLTAAAYRLSVLLVTRFLFGAGEAGAFPGIARATFSWIPMAERGIVQGINFSGSRLGAALAMPLVGGMIATIGWRTSFVILMLVGFAWAVFWFFWFRNDPTEHPRIGQEELDHILRTRQHADAGEAQEAPPLSVGTLLGSRNVWFISAQYFCSNFTFFFCLTWLFPHLKGKYELDAFDAGMYAATPLVYGAFGNWFAGWLVDRIYRADRWVLSRRLPAMVGYLLAAVGLIGSVYVDTPLASCLWFSLAIFGADMTLAPSWSFCVDIGKSHAGVVSGTMNMAGNLGSFLTGLAFPTLALWTGSYTPFFFVAAGLNLLAIGLWMVVRPDRSLEEY